MKLIWILLILLPIIDGESFQNGGFSGSRRFEVPDILPGTGSSKFGPSDAGAQQSLMTPFDDKDMAPPKLSEWNNEFSEFDLRQLIIGVETAEHLQLEHQSSEVGSMFVSICRKCMVSLNVQCITHFCILDTPKRHAFMTGVSLHGDILCSLCKQSSDVTCAMKLCVNPERDKTITETASESGIECMQGFCRWQKQTVVSTGYNNYLNAWWMPQGVHLWVEHMSRELATAYKDIQGIIDVAHNVKQVLRG